MELPITLWIVLMGFRYRFLVGRQLPSYAGRRWWVMLSVTGISRYCWGDCLYRSSASNRFIYWALISGILTTVLIEVIHRYSRVKQDAAIGVTFTSLFA